MENLRANHFESRDSGLNKNEFNLSANPEGRSARESCALPKLYGL